MFAFVVYALAVWYAAARWRRQWLSIFWIVAGFIGLVLVGYFHYRLNIWSEGRIYLPVLRVLLYPYILLVVAVGLFIAALPRSPIIFAHCPWCQYDLRGLDQPVETCPECGMNEELARATLGRNFKGFPAPQAEAALPGALSPGSGAIPHPAPAPPRAGPQWPSTAAASTSQVPASE